MEADIVALQEAAPWHFEVLKDVLPHGAFEPGGGHTGTGIALRHPAGTNRIEMAWRAAWCMELVPADWPQLERPLDVINVHIAAPHVYRPPGYGFVLRRRQLRVLEAHLERSAAAGRATALVGDLNATPLWPVYKRVVSHLGDAAIEAAQRRGRRLHPTWSPRPDGKPRLRLDHGFVRGIAVSDFHVAALAGSDHAAIILDLVSTPPPGASR
jgi:endonuclease/exonuclease/phosphatase family metal-dependent hydrolase